MEVRSDRHGSIEYFLELLAVLPGPGPGGPNPRWCRPSLDCGRPAFRLESFLGEKATGEPLPSYSLASTIEGAATRRLQPKTPRETRACDIAATQFGPGA